MKKKVLKVQVNGKRPIYSYNNENRVVFGVALGLNNSVHLTGTIPEEQELLYSWLDETPKLGDEISIELLESDEFGEIPKSKWSDLSSKNKKKDNPEKNNSDDQSQPRHFHLEKVEEKDIISIQIKSHQAQKVISVPKQTHSILYHIIMDDDCNMFLDFIDFEHKLHGIYKPVKLDLGDKVQIKIGQNYCSSLPETLKSTSK